MRWMIRYRVAAAVLALPCFPSGTETFHYRVEWRFVDAGKAKLVYTQPANGGAQSILDLESTGLVSKLFKVKDVYQLSMDSGLCADSVHLNAQEGKRRRDTRITFDRENRKVQYIERDLNKNGEVINTKELDVAECTHDVIGGLAKLRTMRLEPGQNITMPISDGKKFVQAKIEVQEREQIRTPAGTFKTIRIEASLFNNVLYSRKGRLFVWLTDDDRRVPVQVQARLRFHIGTITFQMLKEDKS